MQCKIVLKAYGNFNSNCKYAHSLFTNCIDTTENTAYRAHCRHAPGYIGKIGKVVKPSAHPVPELRRQWVHTSHLRMSWVVLLETDGLCLIVRGANLCLCGSSTATPEPIDDVFSRGIAKCSHLRRGVRRHCLHKALQEMWPQGSRIEAGRREAIMARREDIESEFENGWHKVRAELEINPGRNAGFDVAVRLQILLLSPGSM